MAVCFHCKTASDQTIRAMWLQELLRATALSDEAAFEFDKVMSQIPSGLPHPESGQRIMNASRKLTMARNDMMMAHNRLNNVFEDQDA